MRTQPTDGTVIAGDLFCASLRLKPCMQKSKTRSSKSSPPRCLPPAVAFALRMSSYAVKRGTPGVACNFSLSHRKASQSLLSLAWKMKRGSTQRAQTEIPTDGWRVTAGAFFVSTFVLEVQQAKSTTMAPKSSSSRCVSQQQSAPFSPSPNAMAAVVGSSMMRSTLGPQIRSGI